MSCTQYDVKKFIKKNCPDPYKKEMCETSHREISSRQKL